jgi:hypothetical protein
MSMPLVRSVKARGPCPSTGHIQSTSSRSVPPGFSGSAAGGRRRRHGRGDGRVGAPDSGAGESCASARRIGHLLAARLDLGVRRVGERARLDRRPADGERRGDGVAAAAAAPGAADHQHLPTASTLGW